MIKRTNATKGILYSKVLKSTMSTFTFSPFRMGERFLKSQNGRQLNFTIQELINELQLRENQLNKIDYRSRKEQKLNYIKRKNGKMVSQIGAPRVFVLMTTGLNHMFPKMTIGQDKA